MSNSPLVQYTRISPNSSNPRRKKIDRITIHHTAGVCSVETLGNIFAPTSRYASSNYGVGSDGRIGMYCEEKNRAWTSSNYDNDHRAITIEVSNSSVGGQWPVSDYVLERTIELCVDICKRNDIKEIRYTGDTSGNLTKHCWFASTSCPGPYLGSRFPYIASEINKRLNGTPSPGGIVVNAEVGQWQSIMNRVYNCGLAVDNSYGPASQAAANAHQLHNKSPQIHSEYVLWLQKELNHWGYRLNQDGYFGPATDRAVRDYQSRRGLRADGWVGKDTVRAILADGR